MDDNQLIKISFICALMGMALLFVLAGKLDLKSSNISEIKNGMVEKNINIKGYVNNINNKGAIQLINVEDNTGNIEAVVYGKSKLGKGDLVEIFGRVSKYDGNLQINVDSIKVIK